MNKNKNSEDHIGDLATYEAHLSSNPRTLLVHDSITVDKQIAQQVAVDIESVGIPEDQALDTKVMALRAEVTVEPKRFIGGIHYYAHEQRDVKEAFEHAMEIVRTFCTNPERDLDGLLLSDAIAYALLEAKGFPIDDLNEELGMCDCMAEVADVLGEYDDWRTKSKEQEP